MTGRYQHISCNDLQLEIVKVQYRGPKYIVVRAYYYRKDFGCGELLLDPGRHTLRIRREDLPKWEYVGRRYL